MRKAKASREGRTRKLERDEYVGLRNALSAAIEKSGLSQREVSKRLGMQSSYVNKILKGNRTLDYVELLDLANVIGISPLTLLKQALQEVSPTKKWQE